MDKKNSHLILEGYTYLDSLPCYEGRPDGKGFPVIVDKTRLPQSQLWISPMVGRITEEQSKALAAGKLGTSLPHVHRANMVYLLLGENESFTAEVTLGSDSYTVTTPASVFVPAGLPHSIRPVEAKSGMYGGLCIVYYAGEYDAEPVPANPLELADTKRLIIQGYQWTSLSSHEGSVEGKGFPVLLSNEHIPEAPTWVCPAMPAHTPEMCAAINSGAGYAGATPHYHANGDEVYLVLGDEDSITLRITLGEDTFDVKPNSLVYMPTNLVHALYPVQASEGTFGGPCAVFVGEDYITTPV